MNRDEKFVHLHVHTEYSLLDGLSQIDRLMNRAVELDMPSLAITDHGVMFGVVDFFRSAKKHNVKPIIGVEAYLARRGMEDRDPKLDKKPYHMLLLAKNQIGYQNLLKLTSEAQLRGYYYQPRIDRDFMAAHSEGIIATTGCLGAQIPQLLMAGQEDEAARMIGEFQDIFGKENFFLELQYHDIDELERVNKWLAEYRRSGHTDVPFLATNDVHYVLKEDHDPHDTLLCIQTGNFKNDERRMRMSDASYHLTSHEEMERVIASQYSWLPDEMRFEALYNTARVAAMTDVDLDTEGYHLPRFPVPTGYDEGAYLRYLVDKGRYWRYGDDADNPLYVNRMNHELNIIASMGFNTYFLIVWDLCEFARHADIWWNVRGSGAGSLVAYCLGITNIDPIQNSLIFERFLNPGRVSMPDIDLDYPDDRRNEMIEYTAMKYGSDKVAAIITFGTMGAKAAIRDVGRALEIPLSEVNEAVSLIPTEARQKKIEEYVNSNPDLTRLYNSNKQLRLAIDTAKTLQGVARHASTHAAGVIVADEPLVNYIPLHRLTNADDSDSTALKQVTQFPMETCESLGLLKVDFLGLSTLTILRRASDLIYKHHDKRWTMDNIPYRPHEGDDLTDEQARENEMLRQAFVMMGEGHTVGVFQVESSGMQQMLRGMRPHKFEHIIAGISLYRPGPMDYIPTYNDRMHGKQEIEYLHPSLESILGETYGIIVYQEQIMQIAGELFGYSLGDADLMRRAVSKKKQKEMVKHREQFLQRGPENGVPIEAAEKIFDDIEFFANYGFNKSHAADYAVITVQTAFLKCHYPAEYMAALLSVYREDTNKVAAFLEECGRLQIRVLPPSVNDSNMEFDIQYLDNGQEAVRFGLAAVKNASVSGGEMIIAAREQDGRFANLNDFAHRVDLRAVGKRTLESLIKAGALDDFGDRGQILAALESIINYSTNYHRDQSVGQMNMFGESSPQDNNLLRTIPESERPGIRDKLAWEKELLGFYLTDHPVDAIIRRFDLRHTTTINSLRQLEEFEMADRSVSIVGLIAGVREISTKKGDMMAILSIEDRAGTLEVVMFPRTWDGYRHVVRDNENQVVLVKGKTDVRRGDLQVICDAVTTEFDTFVSSSHSNGNSHHNGGAVPMSSPQQPRTMAHQAAPAHEPPPREVEQFESDIDWESELAHNPHLHEKSQTHADAKYILVYFQPESDNEWNQRRIKRIHRTFVGHEGNDRFSIVIETQPRPLRMDFNGQHTLVCDTLLDELIQLVGENNIEVFEKP